MPFSFRIRLKLPNRLRIGINSDKWILLKENDKLEISFHSMNSKATISSSTDLVFRGYGYENEKNALEAAEYFKDAITITFSKLRIGADFGDRAPKSAFTDVGLKMLEGDSGHPRILNDVHGIMVFDTEPLPRFATLKAEAFVTKGKEGFISTFQKAFKLNHRLSKEFRMAFELFSASFFQPSPDSRLLMLMMGVETLIKLGPRSDAAKNHVIELIKITKESNQLTIGEKDSLMGSLRWLQNESINQAGKKLAASLEPRTYFDMKPSAFFSYCYDLRSKLVHGHIPQPTRDEVDIAALHLESFLGDILAGPLK